MFTFSAAGSVTPPMIIYPYKRLPAAVAKSVPGEWGIGTSDNGWMKSELFSEYISNILHPHLCKIGIQFPVILFVDGHKTHMTYELSTICTRLQIILVALYPNATRILQPADVSCFKPLKNAWKRAVLKWRRNNPFIGLTKVHFAPILKDALGSLHSSSICNGFEACGIYPWNDKSIDFSKCIGKKQTSGPATAVGTGNVMESCELTYDDFVSIVGPEKLNQIKRIIEYREKNDKSEDFQLLVKIFQKITKLEAAESWSSGIDDSHITVQCDDEDCESHQNNNPHCEARCAGGYEAPVPYFTEENIRGMEIVFGDSLLTQDQVEK
ncbi:hypothetical protein MML48_9g00000110 [Holotrichia oblita]|uniref:Uncharacterized protein n=1 Tax=Holotrichia oblita TaxID=644536 RepID=A0ACB9SK13_HOLOL|nr:hypothetical protein MML48_9g00000110 [Holotrichia oblita]